MWSPCFCKAKYVFLNKKAEGVFGENRQLCRRELCKKVQPTQKKWTFPDMPYLHVLSLL